MINTDVLIIGSGLAALQLATQLDDKLDITILTKSELKTSNSALAQGGISAAIDQEDHPTVHAIDTIQAGCYLNNQDVVTEMTQQAPEIIEQLTNQGCPFDQSNHHFILGKEGAHSHRRIVKSGGDQTGKAIIDTLIKQLPSNVKIIEHAFVYELLTKNQKCFGAKFINANNQYQSIYSAKTVLATGGCGQIYPFTSNCKEATGDGILLAYLAGANLSNLEFIQFHPTILHKDGKTFSLISEAVRGEGAFLMNQDGKRIMKGFHPLEDLAPRHIVAQTIYNHLKNEEVIYLNIQNISDFKHRFPSIANHCQRHDIDLNQGLIPVAPGAHFMMGGITTNLFGETNIKDLYAIGEVANTGFHGANRLASNSLLEGLIMGKRLAKVINQISQKQSFHELTFSHTKKVKSMKLPPIEQLRDHMIKYVGIVRNEQQLQYMINWLNSLDVESYLRVPFESYSKDDIQHIFLFNLALLIAKSALLRRESRGAHFRLDFPYENESYRSFNTNMKLNESGLHNEYVTT